MNGTPRALNRVLLFIIGAKLLAVGVLLLLLATVPAVAAWWHGWSAAAWAGMENAFRQTRFPGREESWLWIVAGAVLVAIIIAMIAWLSQQGKGRANLLVASDDDSHINGEVRIGGGVAEQALRAALAGRTDLAAASVATYEVRGRPGLRIRIQPRQGVAPHLLAAEISQLVEALDLVIGQKTPVLVHMVSGARSRFTKAERVR
ncbi:hypothetical protein WBN73_16535 [Paenarthrobacter sp. CCNWLY172]|uniref:Alkaline shock response membrane anchor protein AmaP n=1 Tax=Paenarthrobacter sp. AMU7 TaxID=3162492 RepID=A0AB39YPQ2_9MICC|nr:MULTISPECIES: hypothetical protein [Micrococcaceae]QSZ47440.1 hypothetical protein AYX22_02755 [Arthrobacter sp. D5-1]WGM21080.1 hypothetical protein QEH68_02490 [Paenarthrobacter sp. OM7]